MKTRYKFLIVIFLLWLGMSYEGARDAPQPVVNREYLSLEEQIRMYEEGLLDRLDVDYFVSDRPAASQQGNLIARSGRNFGNALQTAVREILRGIVRFFDGVIS